MSACNHHTNVYLSQGLCTASIGCCCTTHSCSQLLIGFCSCCQRCPSLAAHHITPTQTTAPYFHHISSSPPNHPMHTHLHVACGVLGIEWLRVAHLEAQVSSRVAPVAAAEADRQGLAVTKQVLMRQLNTATWDEGLASQLGDAVLQLERPVQVKLCGQYMGKQCTGSTDTKSDRRKYVGCGTHAVEPQSQRMGEDWPFN